MGTNFVSIPVRLEPVHELRSHFPNLKTVQELRYDQLATKFLVPLEYLAVRPKPDDTVKRPPTDGITMYLDDF